MLKRFLDFVAALIILLLASPIFLLIMLLIKLDSRGPVFFLQKRVGMHKKYFMIYKFRTMYTSAPKDMPTHLLTSQASHITRIGQLLRKTSLDELPQLINILRGDMSFIGPRPALWNQEDLIAERDKYGANDIRPGLSGWAQVNGRDELSIEDKSRFDGEYVTRQSLLFDLKCAVMTVTSVLHQKGVDDGELTRRQKRT